MDSDKDIHNELDELIALQLGLENDQFFNELPKFNFEGVDLITQKNLVESLIDYIKNGSNMIQRDFSLTIYKVEKDVVQVSDDGEHYFESENIFSKLDTFYHIQSLEGKQIVISNAVFSGLEHSSKPIDLIFDEITLDGSLTLVPTKPLSNCLVHPKVMQALTVFYASRDDSLLSIPSEDSESELSNSKPSQTKPLEEHLGKRSPFDDTEGSQNHLIELGLDEASNIQCISESSASVKPSKHLVLPSDILHESIKQLDSEMIQEQVMNEENLEAINTHLTDQTALENRSILNPQIGVLDAGSEGMTVEPLPAVEDQVNKDQTQLRTSAVSKAIVDVCTKAIEGEPGDLQCPSPAAPSASVALKVERATLRRGVHKQKPLDDDLTKDLVSVIDTPPSFIPFPVLPYFESKFVEFSSVHLESRDQTHPPIPLVDLIEEGLVSTDSFSNPLLNQHNPVPIAEEFIQPSVVHPSGEKIMPEHENLNSAENHHSTHNKRKPMMPTSLQDHLQTIAQSKPEVVDLDLVDPESFAKFSARRLDQVLSPSKNSSMMSAVNVEGEKDAHSLSQNSENMQEEVNQDINELIGLFTQSTSAYVGELDKLYPKVKSFFPTDASSIPQREKEDKAAGRATPRKMMADVSVDPPVLAIEDKTSPLAAAILRRFNYVKNFLQREVTSKTPKSDDVGAVICSRFHNQELQEEKKQVPIIMIVEGNNSHKEIVIDEEPIKPEVIHHIEGSKHSSQRIQKPTIEIEEIKEDVILSNPNRVTNEPVGWLQNGKLITATTIEIEGSRELETKNPRNQSKNPQRIEEEKEPQVLDNSRNRNYTRPFHKSAAKSGHYDKRLDELVSRVAADTMQPQKITSPMKKFSAPDDGFTPKRSSQTSSFSQQSDKEKKMTSSKDIHVQHPFQKTSNPMNYFPRIEPSVIDLDKSMGNINQRTEGKPPTSPNFESPTKKTDKPSIHHTNNSRGLTILPTFNYEIAREPESITNPKPVLTSPLLNISNEQLAAIVGQVTASLLEGKEFNLTEEFERKVDQSQQTEGPLKVKKRINLRHLFKPQKNRVVVKDVAVETDDVACRDEDEDLTSIVHDKSIQADSILVDEDPIPSLRNRKHQYFESLISLRDEPEEVKTPKKSGTGIPTRATSSNPPIRSVISESSESENQETLIDSVDKILDQKRKEISKRQQLISRETKIEQIVDELKKKSSQSQTSFPSLIGVIEIEDEITPEVIQPETPSKNPNLSPSKSDYEAQAIIRNEFSSDQDPVQEALLCLERRLSQPCSMKNQLAKAILSFEVKENAAIEKALRFMLKSLK